MNIYNTIEKLLKNNDKVIIAIDGPSAAGKSTFSKNLADKYNASLFHTDDYYLPKERKTESRLSEIGGNFDYERIKKEIFDNISNEFVTSNSFDCHLNILQMKKATPIKKLIIIEGVYSMHKTLIDNYDLLLFLDINKELQTSRIIKRDGHELLNKWLGEWIPLESIYFEKMNLRSIVDIIIEVKE